MSKKREKDLYKQLEQQVAAAYQTASDEDKARIDALRQTIYNYRGADPMNNRDARRLYIDGYQRMLEMATGGAGYDPTRLGDAVTNEWGYYSPDEITNIGNQLAYKLFHNTQPHQNANYVIGGAGNSGSQPGLGDDWKHMTFQWNKGMMDPGYFTASTTKKQKVEAFAKQLAANLSEVLTKKSEGYVVHGMHDLTSDVDIDGAIRMLAAAQNLDWDNPNEETNKLFQGIGLLASKLQIDPADIAAYFDMDGSTLTDPAAAERAAVLKQLGLRDVDKKNIDPEVLNYLNKNNWQILADGQGVQRVYDSQFNPITDKNYIQDNFGAENAGFGFFVSPDGQYHAIGDIRGENGTLNYDPNDPIFGKQIAKYISDLTQSYAQNPIEWEYRPYAEYTQSINGVDNTDLQALLDQVSTKIKSSKFNFADVSQYFNTNKPIVVALHEGNTKHDMFGRLILPENSIYFTLDDSNNLVTMSKKQLTELGYDYKSYGNRSVQINSGVDLTSDISQYENHPNNKGFYSDNKMYGFTKFGEWLNGADGIANEISENPTEWANNVIDFILDPEHTHISFGAYSATGSKILKEMGYYKNPSEFIRGLFFFLQDSNIINTIDRSKIRDLLKVYNEIVSESSVQMGQQGMLVDIHGNKIDKDKRKQQKVYVSEHQKKMNSPASDGLTGGLSLTSLALDVASMITAWVPGYGTLASGALGLGSSGLNLWNNIQSDGFQGKDLANFGLDVAMDVVGLFGGVGKAGKVMKNLVKLTPLIIGTIRDLPNAKEYIDILEKAGAGEKLTLNEWMAIGQCLSTIAGITRAGASAQKHRKIQKLKEIKSKGASKDVKHKVQVLDGDEVKEIEISSEHMKELKGIKGDDKKSGYDKTNELLEVIDPSYKGYKLIPEKKGYSIKEPFKIRKTRREDSGENPLRNYDLNDSKTQVRPVTQDEVLEAEQELLKYAKAPWFKAIIEDKPWSLLSHHKQGGKLQRLQERINQK